MSDELMGAFIEDSKEHLESIESDIMALENLDGDYDEELINRIFRTVVWKPLARWRTSWKTPCI